MNDEPQFKPVSREELERRRQAHSAEQQELAAAGKTHSFGATEKSLSGGPCRWCGKSLMEGRHI